MAGTDNERRAPTMGERPVAVVVGAAEGIGEAIARRFSGEGFSVALVARDGARLSVLATTIPGAAGFACDITDEAMVAETFARIEATLGRVTTVVYSIGRFVPGDALAVSVEAFETALQVNVLGALFVSRAILPGMIAAGSGSLLFIGATASRRGGANAAAFAAAKAGQRALAESLARAYGPKGIHVCHLVVDAVVDQPRNRTWLPDRPAEAFCDPERIADAALHLVGQGPGGWTFEAEIRPAGENW